MLLFLLAATWLSAAPPSRPANFSGAALGVSSIAWSWSQADGALGYRVLRGTVDLSGDLPAGVTSWVEGGLAPNMIQGLLVVRAFNGEGFADSEPTFATTLAAAPSGPAWTGSALAWGDSGNPAGTVYEILRDAGGGFDRLALTSATAHAVAAGPSYQVRAYNSEGVPTAPLSFNVTR
jgi:hypothetical protein